MARLLDTTVQGNMSVTGNVFIGDNEDSVGTIISRNFDNLRRLFMKYRSLDYTTTKGSNWTIDESLVYLVGNVLRLSGKVTRSSAPSGNIGNEITMTFTIQHEGRITDALNINFANASTGNFSSWYTSGIAVTEETLTVNIVFSGTRSGNTGKTFGFYAHVPVELNTEYYDTSEEE
jgi:hypothetical protein